MIHDELVKRLHEPRRFMQVIAGARQVGKTTLVRQVMESAGLPAHYASADELTLGGDRVWLEQQWEIGRLKAREGNGGALLVLDEIQKIADWSGVVKFHWDNDSNYRVPLKVVLLGSSPLLIQKGLTESLAGRFEVLMMPHWSFVEMRDAFGFSVEQYIYYGGYPGSAGLISDPLRWRRYILDSLFETTISRDILLLNRVDKPALLRQLFGLGCAYAGQILSYQKMLGQLNDAGNTTTLAHYLDLLKNAGMLMGMSKFCGDEIRKRGSSPKLLPLNTALISAQNPLTFEQARSDGDHWGRLVESAVGAHLQNSIANRDIELSYWRERNDEVDYVLRRGKSLAAIEVKSGVRKQTLPGIAAFDRQFKPSRKLLVGGQGIGLEEFLSRPAEYWVG